MGITLDREQLDQLAAALTRYGESSATALANGRDTIRGGAREIADAVNPHIPQVVGHLAAMLPGTGAMDSMRLSREAVGHFGEGRWGSGLETMGDAILAPVNDAFFLLPGGGYVKAIPK